MLEEVSHIIYSISPLTEEVQSNIVIILVVLLAVESMCKWTIIHKINGLHIHEIKRRLVGEFSI